MIDEQIDEHSSSVDKDTRSITVGFEISISDFVEIDESESDEEHCDGKKNKGFEDCSAIFI